MKAQQIFYIYCYDSIRGWVKLPSNPTYGYDTVEQCTSVMKEQSERYHDKEFTVFGVVKTFPT